MLKKYEFNSKTNYNKVIKEIGLTTYHKPIVLGKILLENAEFDEQGNEVKAPVFTKKYCVDIYWNENEDSSVLNDYEVFPENPKHKIAGQ